MKDAMNKVKSQKQKLKPNLSELVSSKKDFNTPMGPSKPLPNNDEKKPPKPQNNEMFD